MKRYTRAELEAMSPEELDHLHESRQQEEEKLELAATQLENEFSPYTQKAYGQAVERAWKKEREEIAAKILDEALNEARSQGDSSISAVLQERGCRYGDFDTHAQITQDLKDIMRKAPKWNGLTAAQKEALEMAQHKVGRILNGDPSYKDSWIDIQGYIKLVADTLKD